VKCIQPPLYRIEGALTRYKQKGEPAELGTIAIELRGLLFKEALFVSLSAEKNFPIEFYTIPYTSLDMDADMRKGLTHFWSGDSISITCEKPWTQRVTFEQWSEIPIAEINGKIITPKILINEIANNLGPAHYSQQIPNDLREMKQFHLGGVPSHFRTLLQFAGCLLVLGKIYLSKY
jgi:hypothetical protein